MSDTEADESAITVYLIDATNETVTARKCESLKALQRFVGGPMETALHFGNGDSLFVDQSGLSKAYPGSRGFQLDGRLFIGHGVIMGCDGSEEPAMPLVRLRPRVEFLPLRRTQGRGDE